jgi:hypothetical protein
MDQRELRAKLLQIEEQAQLTLSEFPGALTKERQYIIRAIARYIRSELSEAGVAYASEDRERTVEGPRPS